MSQVQDFLRLKLQALNPDALLTEAWDQFYQTYSTILSRFASCYDLSASEVDDLVQEVWVKVIRRLPEFHWDRNRGGLRTWLYLLVRSQAIDHIRAKGRRAVVSNGVSLLDEREPLDLASNPADAVEKQWRHELVQTVLEEIRASSSPANYDVIRLRFVEGKSVDEVAAALDMTREQVWDRQHRMLQKIRAAVGAFTGEPLGVNREAS